MQPLPKGALLFYSFCVYVVIGLFCVVFAQTSNTGTPIVEGDQAVKINVDIPEQKLGDALMVLSSQSGLNIVGLSSEMESVDGPAVSGLMTPTEALDSLLTRSGFSYRFVGDNSVSIISGRRLNPENVAIDVSKGMVALEEVVVTADRRSVDLQNSSVAVTHLSAHDIETNTLNDLRDISNWVPGLEFVSTGPQESVLVQLRGVGTTNITEIADGPVSIHIDGIYSPRSQGVAGLLHDVNNVEVLRGPQGTLFGRNSSSGSINVYSREPSLQASELGLEFGFGNYNSRRTQLLGNWRASDSIAVRFSGVQQRHAPYTSTLANYAGLGPQYSSSVSELEVFEQSAGNATGLDSEDRYSWRLSTLWQPNDSIEWLVSAERYRDKGTGSAELDPTLVELGIRAVVLDTKPFVDLKNDVLRSRLTWDFSGGSSLIYHAGLASMSRGQLYDTDQGRTGDFEVERTVSSDFDFYSHELLFKSAEDLKLNWLAGVFTSRESNSIVFAVDQQNRGGQRRLSTVPSWISGLPGAAVSFANQPERRSESFGAYSQLVYRLNQLTRVTLGARYNRDKKSDIGGRAINCRVPSAFGPYSTSSSLGTGAPMDSQIFADTGVQQAIRQGRFFDQGGRVGIGAQPCWVRQVNDLRASWNNVSGLIRVDHKWNDDVLLYGSLASGFKAGHIQDAGNMANPETVISYELGFKTQWIDDRLRINGAAYYANYRDLQFSDDDRIDIDDDGIADAGGSTVVRNASNARVQGVELEVQWRPSKAHNWRGSLALTDARFKQFDIPDSLFGDLFNPFSSLSGADASDSVNLSGNSPPRVPDWKFNLIYSYHHEFSFGEARIGSSATLSDDYFLDIYNRDRLAAGVFESLPNGGRNLGVQKSYFTFDLNAGLLSRDELWNVSIWVKNVSDENIKTLSGTFITENGFIANYAPPRTYGVNLAFNY
jgi:iron complex outermembrane receptor protein